VPSPFNDSRVMSTWAIMTTLFTSREPCVHMERMES
jgi:hypothetical protein